MAISLLLADDSPTIAKILTMALANEDYAVRSVLSADLAVAELRKNPPDIFLIDLTLPEKDGYSLCHFVKNEPGLRKVRVGLLASAFDPAEDAKVKACGADSVIVKPFDPNELRAKLREMMNNPQILPPGSHVEGSTMGKSVSIDTPVSAEPDTSAHVEMDADSLLHSLVHNTDTNIPLEDEVAPPPPTLKQAAAEEGLSPNAQALAEFFNAEVESYKTNETNQDFAIDLTNDPIFEAPEAISLSGWSSAPSPASITKPTGAPPPTSSSATASSTDSPSLFDTGGSTFRFSSDYTRRITRAFTGDLNEHVPMETTKASHAPSVFPVASDDSASWAVPNISLPEVDSSLEIALEEPHSEKNTAPFIAPQTQKKAAQEQSAPFFMPPPEQVAPAPHVSTPSSGALSAEETAKIEQMIREEVHLVCREIVEKVAWEVIPELAENLIKKELQKVMEQLEQ